MHESWHEIFKLEFSKPYFKEIVRFLVQERCAHQVYPPESDVFTAFNTGLDCVRVVILGQDPYHGPGQAHGLAFSVRPGVQVPPSLVNIYRELHDDVGVKAPSHGCLTAWAKRGVLLLNTSLTVRSGQAGSHSKCGWHEFTDAVITALSNRKIPMVFILWGSHAQSKIPAIHKRHHIISSAHPSPLSAHKGFFGSRPFSRANQFLAESDVGCVDWSLPADPLIEVTESKPIVGPIMSSDPILKSL